jgi:hypothetical protein
MKIFYKKPVSTALCGSPAFYPPYTRSSLPYEFLLARVMYLPP